jgi:hypothetical protein
MNTNNSCGLPWDTGYANACQICGIPVDANNFDVADIKAAPQQPGEEVEVAKYALTPQYCGILLYFAQYVEPVIDVIPAAPQNREIFRTPGYEWVILCNNQPRHPYLPTRLILNPWGYNAFPIHLRLEEGCVLRFVVRKVLPPAGEQEIPLAFVGGRLLGRYWYNTIYGGAPHRL